MNNINEIYMHSLNRQNAMYRQTILNADWSHAVFYSTLRKSPNPFDGTYIWTVNWSTSGVAYAMKQVQFPIKQHFRYVQAVNISEEFSARLQYFKDHIVPAYIQISIDRQIPTIVFVPSYFDYISLKQYTHSNYRESFTYLDEYMSIKEQKAALAEFSSKEKVVLIMTERFFFFKRYFVKKANRIVFYAPPANFFFYSYLINKLDYDPINSLAITLYTSFDAHQILPLVGQEHTDNLISNRKSNAFFFTTKA